MVSSAIDMISNDAILFSASHPSHNLMDLFFFFRSLVGWLVASRCSAEGRPMDKEEWDSLLQVAETVASEIKRISFDFGTEVGNGGGDQ